MNHLIRLIVLPVCLWIGSTLALADAPTKIGVIDFQQLMTKAPQAEEAGKRLEKEFQGPQEKLVNKQKELLAKRDKLKRDEAILSIAERSKKEKEVVKLEQELRRMDEEINTEFNSRRQEEMGNFAVIVKEVVSKLAKEEKFDLVLTVQGGTIFMADRIDLTDAVLKRLAQLKSTKSTDKSESSKSDS